MLNIYKKRFYLLLLSFSLLALNKLSAQQLPQINYQGVARKADGSPIMEQTITLKLTIHDGSATGNSVYSESRQLTTNKFGLFAVAIGSGGATSQTGTITGVNWATGNKFLQVEVDLGSGFLNMGTSQLQSVPYAVYAGSAAPVGAGGGDLSGTFPNPTVSKIQGSAVSNAAPVNGQILKWNGTAWTPSDAASAVGTVSGNMPIISSSQGGNVSLSINKADAVNDGYLSKTDWATFNDKADIAYIDAAADFNSTALTTETSRATTAEGVLTANLTSESSRATTEEGVLSTNLTTEVNRATTAEAAKEDIANKSVSIATDATSDSKYPSVKSVKDYVDATVISGSTPDATTTSLGKIKLAGDLEGTADLPVIADSKITTSKLADASVTDAKLANGISASKVGLGNVDNTSDVNKPISTATQDALDLKPSATTIQTSLDLKADLASPTFTGTVGGITASMVGLGNVDNTTDLLKPISTATQDALDLKSSAADTQTSLDLKADLASPTFTGTVGGITASMVGLGNVDNTTDLLKPISTATQDALDLKSSAADTQTSLDLKADLASPTFTGTVGGITATMVGLGNVDNTTDLLKPISTATQDALDLKSSAADTQTSLDLKADLTSPTFTGTVGGITATMVGLGNVDNTTDLLKPISTATQDALDLKSSAADTQTSLDLKADLASPTFTGTVGGITASMVGLGNVDNTTDLLKPISTATQDALDLKSSAADTQTSLDLKADLASPTFTGIPLAPTATAGENTAQIATTEFVTAALTLAATDTLSIERGGTNSAAPLNNFRIMHSNDGKIVEADSIVADFALVSDAHGIPTQSGVSTVELNQLAGVTGPVQAQFNQLNLKFGTPITADLVMDNTSSPFIRADVSGNLINITLPDPTAFGPLLVIDASSIHTQSNKLTVTSSGSGVIFDKDSKPQNYIANLQYGYFINDGTNWHLIAGNVNANPPTSFSSRLLTQGESFVFADGDPNPNYKGSGALLEDASIVLPDATKSGPRAYIDMSQADHKAIVTARGNGIIYDLYNQKQTQIRDVVNAVFVSDGLTWHQTNGYDLIASSMSTTKPSGQVINMGLGTDGQIFIGTEGDANPIYSSDIVGLNSIVTLPDAAKSGPKAMVDVSRSGGSVTVKARGNGIIYDLYDQVQDEIRNVVTGVYISDGATWHVYKGTETSANTAATAYRAPDFVTLHYNDFTYGPHDAYFSNMAPWHQDIVNQQHPDWLVNNDQVNNYQLLRTYSTVGDRPPYAPKLFLRYGDDPSSDYYPTVVLPDPTRYGPKAILDFTNSKNGAIVVAPVTGQDLYDYSRLGSKIYDQFGKLQQYIKITGTAFFVTDGVNWRLTSGEQTVGSALTNSFTTPNYEVLADNQFLPDGSGARVYTMTKDQLSIKINGNIADPAVVLLPDASTTGPKALVSVPDHSYGVIVKAAGNGIIFDQYGQSQTMINNVTAGVYVTDGLSWHVFTGGQASNTPNTNFTTPAFLDITDGSQFLEPDNTFRITKDQLAIRTPFSFWPSPTILLPDAATTGPKVTIDFSKSGADITIKAADGSVIYDQNGQSKTEITNLRSAIFVTDGISWRVDSSNQPKVFMPTRMTAQERDAITNPVPGMVIWCTDNNGNGGLQFYSMDGNWSTIGQ